MKIRVFPIAVCLMLTVLPVLASTGNQLFKLLSNDGAAGDQLGLSVAVSGTMAIVGARQDDDHGTNSGSAYLFDTTTGIQLRKLSAGDGADFDSFGHAVGIDGEIAIAGSHGDEDNGMNSGSAYLFDTVTGQQLFKLLANDGAASDQLGWSVGISGRVAIVGAPLDDDNGMDSGSAYLFDTSTGLQIHKLLASDGAALDQFGSAVGISGSIAIVGAWSGDDNGMDSGAAYLFDVSTGLQVAKLLPNDGATNDRFGYSVAIDGSTAIVGAWWDDDNGAESGSAYLFDTGTGLQTQKLLADDGAQSDQLGISVGIHGTIAIVGGNQDDDNGADSGSAYLFETTTGAQFKKLLASDGMATDFFGYSVGISDVSITVGAFQVDDNGDDSGATYVYDLGNGFCFGVTCPCGNDDASAGCRNSTGKGGRLVAASTNSLAAGTLVLSASDLPPGNLGLFVAADSVLGLPAQVGDGSICIGGSNVYRFAPSMVGLDGRMTLVNVVPSAPPGFFVSGEVRYFQAWSRDVFCSPVPVPCPSPCGNASNITNAVQVCFVP